jgi:CRP-like cAMP-binding protein
MFTGFIASLPDDVRVALEPLVKSIHCPRGTMLFDLADTIESVWFPEKKTIVSLVIPLVEGETIETGFVGHWGLVGGSALLNGKTALCKALVQSGDALHIASIDQIREVMTQHPSFQSRVLAHEQFLYAQAQQTAACNAVHRVETRLCRWLLQARDTAESDTLDFTQEFVGHILSVRRTTVTLIARHLQSLGFIKYTRGRIQLIDVPGLEDAACECHKSIKDSYNRLLVRRENAP